MYRKSNHKSLFFEVSNFITTHHNKEDEVDPVPEGVGVLHKVHHVRPSLQADDL